MKKTLILLSLFSSSLLAPNSHAETYEQLARTTKTALKKLKTEHNTLRSEGERKYTYFKKKFADTQHHTPTVSQMFKFLSNSDNIALSTPAQTRRIINAAASFFHYNLPDIVRINTIQDLKLASEDKTNLLDEVIFFGTGLIDTLNKTESYYLSSSLETRMIKNKAINLLSPIVSDMTPMSGSDNWKLAYLYAFYAAHTNYPADILLRFAASLSSIIKDKDSSNTHKAAASSLLLELTSFASVYATTPTGDSRQLVARSKEEYLTDLYQQCENACTYGKNSYGFNKIKLKHLRANDKKGYIEFRKKLAKEKIWNNITHSFKSLIGWFTGSSHGALFVFMKRLITSILESTYMSIGYILEFSSTKWLFLISGIALIARYGKRNIPLLSAEKPSPRINNNNYLRWSYLLLNIEIYCLKSPYQLLKSIIYNIIFAVWAPRSRQATLGINLLLIFLTMYMSEAKEYLSSNIP